MFEQGSDESKPAKSSHTNLEYWRRRRGVFSRLFLDYSHTTNLPTYQLLTASVMK